ncbi:GNAT family N-acetyltransferase [Saccharomonospora saliphila]|uniref:GNAT family N-acetyltransferase n=1 Tax=Saccharomonospora saliphila TaxID=369829 RepID=UPI001E2C6522|nr:GNAT family N-acetyltransferase [Saccharomonospora saliphila]
MSIHPLREEHLDTANRIMRTAFGTFLGIPEPITVFGDAEYVRPRFTAEPSWAFVAELDDEVVGSNFVTNWGSFGYFGPITVRPDLWGQGIASHLMRPVMELFDRWQVRQAGLFTFPQSPRHIGLYQKFGFWPQYLTPLMEKPVSPGTGNRGYSTYSGTPETERGDIVRGCFEVTDAVFDGLDLTHEINATQAQGSATPCSCMTTRSPLGSPCATAARARPAVARASSSSERCVRSRTRPSSSNG